MGNDYSSHYSEKLDLVPMVLTKHVTITSFGGKPILSNDGYTTVEYLSSSTQCGFYD